jgi:hypothetical protein
VTGLRLSVTPGLLVVDSDLAFPHVADRRASPSQGVINTSIERAFQSTFISMTKCLRQQRNLFPINREHSFVMLLDKAQPRRERRRQSAHIRGIQGHFSHRDGSGPRAAEVSSAHESRHRPWIAGATSKSLSPWGWCRSARPQKRYIRAPVGSSALGRVLRCERSIHGG